MRVIVLASVVVAAACGAKETPPPAKRTHAARARELDSLTRLP